MWEYLQKKYSKPSKLDAAQYRPDLNNFKFTTDITIVEAWNNLKNIRRRKIAAKPSAKGQYDDESLLLTLTTALPEAYHSAADDLNINENLSVEDQLKNLECTEERLRMSRDLNESALVSRKGNPRLSQRRGSNITTSIFKNVECFLCEGDHYVVEYEFLDHCKNVISIIKDQKIKKLRRHKQIHYKYKPKTVQKKLHGLVGADENSDLTDTQHSSSSSDHSEDYNFDVAAVTKERMRNSSNTPTIC